MNRRSQKCFAEAQKNLKQGETGLAVINQIVGLINQRMEGLDSDDIRAQADRNLDAYLTKLYLEEGGLNAPEILNSHNPKHELQAPSLQEESRGESFQGDEKPEGSAIP